MINEEKKKALDAAIAKLEKAFWKRSSYEAWRVRSACGCGDSAYRMLKS